MTRRRRLCATLAVMVVATCAAVAVAWASARSNGAEPRLRGDAVWAPGQRPAPAFALRDQHGRLVSTASLRGHPWLVVFLDSRCRTQCPVAGRELGSAERRLGGRPVRLVVISVDPTDTPASVRHAAHDWGWRGDDWSWLMGTHAQLQPVWRAYGIGVIPQAGDIEHVIATFVIDANGDQRAAFMPPIAVPQLVRDVTLVRSARGA